MKIAQALKEHLELNKIAFTGERWAETGWGHGVERVITLDMEALMQEIDVFCETFKEGCV